MTIAAYAYETNEAQQARELVYENCTLYIDDHDIILDDGINKKIIDFDTF